MALCASLIPNDTENLSGKSYLLRSTNLLLILPNQFLVNPSQQRSDSLDSLKNLPRILARYQIYETHLVGMKQAEATSLNAYKEFMAGIVEIYK